ncbi:hypothetical protein NL676_006655 [Syzygium grande]|nr:hypothetical protein NL676_006655 [Syzygium grande]
MARLSLCMARVKIQPMAGSHVGTFGRVRALRPRVAFMWVGEALPASGERPSSYVGNHRKQSVPLLDDEEIRGPKKEDSSLRRRVGSRSVHRQQWKKAALRRRFR